MNKGKKSMLNAVTALVQMAAVSIIGLILTKSIILYYGSGYNGVNSTVNQIVNAILMLEGGFTLASNVALFTPFSNKDYITVNGIVSATRKRFLVVGIISILAGIIVSVIYPLFVNVDMPAWQITAIMITVLVPACFNLAITMKYRVLILADQKEYIISIFSTITYILGTCSAIIAIHSGKSLLFARIIIMLSLLVNYLSIIIYCRIKYPWVNFHSKPLYEKIKGTKSVLVMKLTSMFYMSFPVIVISTLPENGAKLASVYAVYKSVTTVVGGAIGAFINAPRLGFGALFAEGRKADAERLFDQYEKITCIVLSIVLGTTCLLIMPFVELYTRGVKDIEYANASLAVIILSTVFFETIHIPSGQIIQMSGDFESYRKIQSISCIFLVVLMIVGRATLGIYGIIGAVMATAVLIAVMEIYYTGWKIFNRSIGNLLRNTLPCLSVCIGGCIFGFSGIINLSTYISFGIIGAISFILIALLSICLYFVTDHSGMKRIAERVFGILRKRKKH